MTIIHSLSLTLKETISLLGPLTLLHTSFWFSVMAHWTHTHTANRVQLLTDSFYCYPDYVSSNKWPLVTVVDNNDDDNDINEFNNRRPM